MVANPRKQTWAQVERAEKQHNYHGQTTVNEQLMTTVTTEYGLEVELKTGIHWKFVRNSYVPRSLQQAMPLPHLGRRLKIYSLEKI